MVLEIAKLICSSIWLGMLVAISLVYFPLVRTDSNELHVSAVRDGWNVLVKLGWVEALICSLILVVCGIQGKVDDFGVTLLIMTVIIIAQSSLIRPAIMRRLTGIHPNEILLSFKSTRLYYLLEIVKFTSLIASIGFVANELITL